LEMTHKGNRLVDEGSFSGIPVAQTRGNPGTGTSIEGRKGKRDEE